MMNYAEASSGLAARWRRLVRSLVIGIGPLALMPYCAFAQTPSTPGNPCPRPAAGSLVTPPPDLFSSDNALNLAFNYFTTTDSAGRTLFCFVTADSNALESPTLHLNPGDTLNIAATNKNPQPPAGSPTQVVSNPSNQCGDKTMTITSLNMHFHGTNTTPACHGDQVIHTIINSGETFDYSLKFPSNEPPGLYWYHPHVHGISEAAVQGGASGAIVVNGIENIQPAVAGLPERILIIRDQNVAGNPTPGGAIPSWDVTLNYVPIAFPAETPAIIQMKPGQKEFWRVANAAADTIIDLQVVYDGVPQTLQIVGLDGVPVGSQDGTGQGKLVPQTDILLAPAARAEFIVTGPSTSVKKASFITLNINTGPDGDNDPTRTLATIQATSHPMPTLPVIPAPSAPAASPMFAGLATATVTARRTLYFSEVLQDPSNPSGPTNFFITVDGATPTLFDPNNPPSIVTHQGAVEDWTIQNRSMENHEFHFHQIHFLLLAANGVPVPSSQQQFLDMIQIPFWSGTGPYPSVTVRMDFRGMDIGDFVYHCHILGHEDNGMMAIIRVLAPPS
jgi:FtsP/CotA-like multicopper oxidase with cupredoxin domain